MIILGGIINCKSREIVGIFVWVRDRGSMISCKKLNCGFKNFGFYVFIGCGVLVRMWCFVGFVGVLLHKETAGICL